MAIPKHPYQMQYARRSAELDYMNKEIMTYEQIRVKFNFYKYLKSKVLIDLLSEKIMKYAINPNTRPLGVYLKKANELQDEVFLKKRYKVIHGRNRVETIFHTKREAKKFAISKRQYKDVLIKPYFIQVVKGLPDDSSLQQKQAV